MGYGPEKHHRHSIRLRGYDYRAPGAYFVTIVTQGRENLFGQIIDGEMHLNDAGRMVERWWHELNRKFPHVRIDVYVIMPNHFHGIIQILPSPSIQTDSPPPDDGRGRPACLPPSAACPPPSAACPPPSAACPPPSAACPPPSAHPSPQEGAHAGAPLQEIVQWFKTMTTNEYIRGVKQHGWPPFDRRLWQRNYYEHIIRNEEDWEAIRYYILTNPLRWQSDKENPLEEAMQR